MSEATCTAPDLGDYQRTLKSNSFCLGHQSKRCLEDYSEFSQRPFFSQRLHASRVLLLVEWRFGKSASGFGFTDRLGIPFHFPHSSPFHPQETRPSIQLGIRVLWRVHSRLRGHPRDGGLDLMARNLLALWCGESCHCPCVGSNCNTPDASGAAGTSTAQS